MKIELEIKRCVFEAEYNPYFTPSGKDDKIFSCKLRMEFADDSIPHNTIWQGKLNFVEIQKMWIVGRNSTEAFLMLKDESKEIAAIAAGLTKYFGGGEWPEICLAGTPIFHDFVAGRNVLINDIITHASADKEAFKTDIPDDPVPKSD